MTAPPIATLLPDLGEVPAFLLDSTLKGVVVLAATGLVAALTRRRTAALRHLCDTMAVFALVVLPVLSLATPSWKLPVLPRWVASEPAAPSAPAGSLEDLEGIRPFSVAAGNPAPGGTPRLATDAPPAAEQERPGPSGTGTPSGLRGRAPVLLGAAWLAGAILVLLQLALGTWAAGRLARSAEPLLGSDWTDLLRRLCRELRLKRRVRLVLSGARTMPMTWGAVRPVVFLPAEAAGWGEERRRLVLLHELAHVRRWDCLTQWMVQVACALYWLNPLVWLTARRMRIEREQACDDVVLRGGTRASDYAGLMLELTRNHRRALPALPAAIAMALPSQLSRRVQAILAPGHDCRGLTGRAVAMAAALTAAALVPLSVAHLTSCAQVPVRPPAAGGEAWTPAPAARAAPAPKPEDLACLHELDEIRDLHRKIGQSFYGLSGDEIREVTERARTCRRRLEDFITRCADAPCLAEGRYLLGRVLLSLNGVVWSDLVAEQSSDGRETVQILKLREPWAEEYFGRIIELGAAALEKLEPGSPLRAACLDLLADASLEKKDPESAHRRQRQLLEEFPGWEGRCGLALAEARALSDLGRFPEALAAIRKAMADCPRDPSYPHYLEWLWRINERAGDLDALPGVIAEMRREFPARLKREGLGRAEREAYERNLAYSGFRLGYALFALGDYAGARRAFEDHQQSLDALELELGKQNRALPPNYAVYRTRSKDNLSALELVGKPADLKLLRSANWVGVRPPALEAGKPLAIVFRGYGDDRSAPFLKALDRYARAHPGTFEPLAITFLRGGADPEGQEIEALKEAEALGVECPLGFDSDVRSKALFRAFEATVGSATFVIVDRAGLYAWFQQDPREIDDRFSTAILERVLKS